MRDFDILIYKENNEEELTWNFKEVSKVIKRAASNENSQFIFDYDPNFENIEIIKAIVRKGSSNYRKIKVTLNDIFYTEIQKDNEQFTF